MSTPPSQPPLIPGPDDLASVQQRLRALGEAPPPEDGRASFTERPQMLDRRSVQESMAEAANRPLDFNPASRAQTIRESVLGIKRMIAADKTESEIRSQYQDFSMSFPELFKKLIAGEDISHLTSMLHMLDKMSTGDLSQHQASMIVGTRLAERFLPPQFRPSQQQNHRR